MPGAELSIGTRSSGSAVVLWLLLLLLLLLLLPKITLTADMVMTPSRSHWRGARGVGRSSYRAGWSARNSLRAHDKQTSIASSRPFSAAVARGMAEKAKKEKNEEQAAFAQYKQLCSVGMHVPRAFYMQIFPSGNVVRTGGSVANFVRAEFWERERGAARRRKTDHRQAIGHPLEAGFLDPPSQ